MKDVLEIIKEKYKIDLAAPSPISLVPLRKHREMVEIFRLAGFVKGAEIGVASGINSAWMCRGIPGLKLFSIDPYIYYDDFINSNLYIYGEKTLINRVNVSYELAKERLKKYPNCEIIKKFSMDAVKDFSDNSLDFVYIDGNHAFEYTINDIAEWSKKVRPGGVIAGDDYCNMADIPKIENFTMRQHLRFCQVKDAVDAWTKTNQISPWFIGSILVPRHNTWPNSTYWLWRNDK